MVDREGVTGVAERLGYSVRQLQRVLADELGASPLALARAQRHEAATRERLIRLLLRSLQSLQLLPGLRNRLCQQPVLLRDQLRIPQIGRAHV